MIPTIDKEFQSLIPPLSDTEFEQLERNILAEGIRDALVVWRGIVLDGHNRFAIAQAHGMDYKTAEIDLPDRNAGAMWIVRNQLGRRNLTPQQSSYLRGKWYAQDKKTVGKPAGIILDQNDPISTAERIAKETGVSAPTIKRDAEYAAAVDKIAEIAGDDARRAILSSEVRMTKKDVKYAADLAADAPELIPQIASGDLTIPQAKRELKERKREAQRESNRELVESAPPITALPNVRYQTIVLDPPWDWGDEGDCDQLGRARPTYDTMPFAEILALPIAELTEKDAHIYLWITNRSLPKGFQLLDAWGFRYITALTWCKPHFGMGNYFRGSTEHVLFGVRGSLPLLRKDVGTWFAAQRPGRHSGKPDEFYELVQSCSPGPWLEMFARQERPGWVSWGAEV